MTKAFEYSEKINKDANYIIFRIFPYMTLFLVFASLISNYFHENDKNFSQDIVYHCHIKFDIYPNMIYYLSPLLILIPIDYETRVNPYVILFKIMMLCINLECYHFENDSHVFNISNLTKSLAFLNLFYFHFAVRIIELLSLLMMFKTIGKITRQPITIKKSRAFLDVSE